MGARGKAPAPAKLRVLKGNGVDRDQDSNVVRRQPQDVPFLPDAPDHLPELAAAQWDHVAAGLRRMEIAGPVDVAALEAFCLAYARMRDAEAVIATDGMFTAGSTGQLVAHPAVAISAQARQQIGTLGAQLGLTPAARLRMTLPEAKVDDKEEALFGRRPAR